MNYGKVEMEGTRASLVFERLIKHPRERIWQALTRSEEFEAWHIGSVLIEGGEGGYIEMVTGPARFHWSGRILQWRPPELLEYEMNAEPQEHLHSGEESVVRYELKQTEEGTLLTVRHTLLTPRTAVGFAPGTHALLDRLSAHLDGRPMPSWQKRYDEVREGYPDWPG